MFKEVVVLLKEGLEIEFEIVDYIKKISQDSKVKIISFANLKKSDLDDADLVITLGGDGTFIKAANLVVDSLILGINAEPNKSEGALTSLNINEIERLKEIFLGKFETILRHRARVKINGNVINEQAVNEVSDKYIAALEEMVRGFGGKLECGELVMPEKSAGRLLSSAVYARWGRE